MEIPWMALRGSGAFPAGLGGFLSTPAGRGRGKKDRRGRGWRHSEHGGDTPKTASRAPTANVTPPVTGTPGEVAPTSPSHAQSASLKIPKIWGVLGGDCTGEGKGTQDRATVPEVMKFLLSSVPPRLSPREFCFQGSGDLSRGCWRRGDKQGGVPGEIQEIGKGLKLSGWVFLPSFQPFPIFPTRYRYPQPTLPFLLQLVCQIIQQSNFNPIFLVPDK